MFIVHPPSYLYCVYELSSPDDPYPTKPPSPAGAGAGAAAVTAVLLLALLPFVFGCLAAVILLLLPLLVPLLPPFSAFLFLALILITDFKLPRLGLVAFSAGEGADSRVAVCR